MRRSAAIACLLLLGLTVLPSGVAVAGGPTVSIVGRSYDPDHPVADITHTITWDNQSTAEHTATSEHPFQKVFNTGAIAPSTSEQTIVHYAGTYAFKCKFHKKMKGTLKVALHGWNNPIAMDAPTNYTVADDALPKGTYFETQVRRDGGKWKTIHTGRQQVVPHTFHHAGDWDVHVRMVHKASGDAGKWSPIYNQTVT